MEKTLVFKWIALLLFLIYSTVIQVSLAASTVRDNPTARPKRKLKRDSQNSSHSTSFEPKRSRQSLRTNSRDGAKFSKAKFPAKPPKTKSPAKPPKPPKTKSSSQRKKPKIDLMTPGADLHITTESYQEQQQQQKDIKRDGMFFCQILIDSEPSHIKRTTGKEPVSQTFDELLDPHYTDSSKAVVGFESPFKHDMSSYYDPFNSELHFFLFKRDPLEQSVERNYLPNSSSFELDSQLIDSPPLSIGGEGIPSPIPSSLSPQPHFGGFLFGTAESSCDSNFMESSVLKSTEGFGSVDDALFDKNIFDLDTPDPVLDSSPAGTSPPEPGPKTLSLDTETPHSSSLSSVLTSYQKESTPGKLDGPLSLNTETPHSSSSSSGLTSHSKESLSGELDGSLSIGSLLPSLSTTVGATSQTSDDPSQVEEVDKKSHYNLPIMESPDKLDSSLYLYRISRSLRSDVCIQLYVSDSVSPSKVYKLYKSAFTFNNEYRFLKKLYRYELSFLSFTPPILLPLSIYYNGRPFQVSVFEPFEGQSIINYYGAMVFPLYEMTLAKFIDSSAKLNGISEVLIFMISFKMLECYKEIAKAKILHYNLHPDDILLKGFDKNPNILNKPMKEWTDEELKKLYESIDVRIINFSHAVDLVKETSVNTDQRFPVISYASPELLVPGLTRIDHLSQAIDIWALGMIMIEMLLGFPYLSQFDSYEENEIIWRIQHSSIYFNGKQPLLALPEQEVSKLKEYFAQIEILSRQQLPGFFNKYKYILDTYQNNKLIVNLMEKLNKDNPIFELLESCLDFNPQKRPKIDSILTHPFFQRLSKIV